MSWIYFNSVTIANGSKVVSVNSGEDITNVNVGDALIVNNLAPVEIYRAYIDGSNNKFIELVNAWDGATQTTQNADIFPTAGSFITATEKLRNATAITEGNFKTLEEWGTQMGTTTFTGYDNSENTARTLLQMDADVQALQTGNDAIIDTAVENKIGEIRYSKLDNPLVHLFKKNKLVDTLKGQLSWKRNSGATYIDRYGVLQYSPSPSATNLLLWSEDFSNAVWTGSGGILTANQTIAPDGTLTADRWTTTDNGVNDTLTQGFTINSDVTVTISLWVKSASTGKDNFRLRAAGQASENLVATEEWQRVEFTATTTTNQSSHGILDGLPLTEGLDIYIWGIQLEESRVANGYVKTEDTSVSGTSYMGIDVAREEKEGRLIEGESTNIMFKSEDANWGLITGATTSKGFSAPDGSMNAIEIKENTASGEHFMQFIFTPSQAGNHTTSVFVKAGTAPRFKVQIQNVDVTFDASTMEVLSSTGEYTVTPLMDGWYRVSVTKHLAVELLGSRVQLLDSNSRVIYDGNGSNTVYAFGHQVEELPFASSYIPTEDSAVTRGTETVVAVASGNAPDTTKPYTASIRANLFSMAGFGSPMSIGNVFAISKNDSGKGYASVNHSGGAVYTGFNHIVEDKVRMYTLVVDEEYASFYVDGELVNQESIVGLDLNSIADSDTGLLDFSDDYFSTNSDARFYDFALNETQIKFLAGE